MNAFTLNRNFIANDFLFIAACGRTCADLMDSYNMDRRVTLEANNGRSLGAKLRSFFLAK